MCWDEARDARTYAGPWPVVAHPPCGPWGRLKFLCTKQDASCAPAAVAAVQRFGGVLEPPHGSSLWHYCSLPFAGELPDRFGGRTYEVRQVAWGHASEKPALLYVVGARVTGIRTGGVATHRVTNGSRGKTWLPRLSNERNRRTPPAFAEWLLTLAAQAQAPKPSSSR
jgi:hypothetical protein